jgi:hypothetical protein
VGSTDDNPDFAYNTRVESIRKRYNKDDVHQGWTLLLRKFVKLTEDVYEEKLWEEVSLVRSRAFAYPVS